MDSISYKLRKMGLSLDDKKVESITMRVKTLSEKKKRVLTEDEFSSIIKELAIRSISPTLLPRAANRISG
jgi:isopropylmalate/homocitrate/citramalate synthase